MYEMITKELGYEPRLYDQPIVLEFNRPDDSYGFVLVADVDSCNTLKEIFEKYGYFNFRIHRKEVLTLWP